MTSGLLTTRHVNWRRGILDFPQLIVGQYFCANPHYWDTHRIDNAKGVIWNTGAPHHHLREQVTPAGRGRRHAARAEEPPVDCHAAMTGAQRLKRVFKIDLETCASWRISKTAQAQSNIPNTRPAPRRNSYCPA